MEAAEDTGTGALDGALMQTLLMDTELAMAATDAHGRMFVLTPALQELLGKPYQPIQEAAFAEHFELYEADGLTPVPPHEVPLARARRGQSVRDHVVVTRRPDGVVKHLRCNASPLRGADGSVQGAVVVVSDITTERVAMLQQDVLRDRLVATVTHELRTPLTTLLGHTELLDAMRAELPEDARRSLDAMLGAGQRLTHIVSSVSELVDLGKRCHVARVTGDLAAFVRRAVEEMQTIADERDIELVTTAPVRLSASFDPDRLGLALGALIENAVLYSPDGCPVRVEVAHSGDWLQVAVADLGSGISPDERARLVEPFERGSHLNQVVDGRGLGLAVAGTVARAHGGELLLVDNEPRGLRAVLTLDRYGDVVA